MDYQIPEERIKNKAPNKKSDDVEMMNEPSEYNDKAILTHGSDYYLTWKSVNLKVQTRNKKKTADVYSNSEKTILNDVSGYAKSGECLAIVGGSGAGKSTLLNIISNRFMKKDTMKLESEVALNGDEFTWDKYKNITGFVMQSDIFFDEQKVKEVFNFTIDMSSPALNKAAKLKKEKDMIKKLKLEKSENNYIGGLLNKGISGGEKRRLNLGAEQLTDPKILFLDEPTSGLDSYTSFIIVENLKKLARVHNMIIIYTIHQPSIEIAKLFDNLLVLHKGSIMYFGKYSRAVDYYAELGFRAAPTKNPVEFFIEVSAKANEPTMEIFAGEFDIKIRPLIENVIESCPSNILPSKVEKASFIQQFAALSNRNFKNFVRNPLILHGRIFQTLMLALIFSLMYGGLAAADTTDPLTIYNRTGALFFLAISIFVGYFQQTLIVCNIISSNRKAYFPQRIRFRPLFHYSICFI